MRKLILAAGVSLPALAHAQQQQSGTVYHTYPPAGAMDGTEIIGPVYQNNKDVTVRSGLLVGSTPYMVTGGGIARTAADRGADTIDAREFGVWTPGGDVSFPLLAAIQAAAPGQCVMIPVGRFNISLPFAEEQTVCLRSVGSVVANVYALETQSMSMPTTLVWTGAAGETMFTVAPVSDTNAGVPIRNIELTGIGLDGNKTAAVGLTVKSVFSGRITAAVQNTTANAFLFDTVPLSQPNDVQGLEMRLWCNQAGTSGNGITIQNTGSASGSSSNGNFSGNWLPIVGCLVNGGVALNAPAATNNVQDNNHYGFVGLSNLKASTVNTINFGSGSSIHFDHLGYGQSTFYVGAAVGGIVIDQLDTSNATNAPTVQSGAPTTITFTDSQGIQCANDSTATYHCRYGATFGTYPGIINWLKTGYPNSATSLQIVADSNDIQITAGDNSSSWSIDDATSTGNLRLLRETGSGSIELDAPVTAGSIGPYNSSVVLNITGLRNLTVAPGNNLSLSPSQTTGLAGNATSGFLLMPTIAGPPTGAPTQGVGNGAAPFAVDGTHIWVYLGGVWKSAPLN
jgi:hypothetical protein